MDYNLLLQLKDRANKVKTDLPPEVAAGFNDSFNVEYAHNSTAIEGNTLTPVSYTHLDVYKRQACGAYP